MSSAARHGSFTLIAGKMHRSRISFLVLAGALISVACDSSPVGPGSPVSRTSFSPTPSRMSADLSSDPAAPASFYQACLANGSLDAVSSIGNSTSASVVCKGKGSTAVVLRAGSGLGFCYQPGKSPSNFTVGGIPSCKGQATSGSLAAGNDYYGCVNNGSLANLTVLPLTCGKGTLVGLSTPHTYTLTVANAGDGTGSVTSDVGGIDCPTACSAAFIENTSVTLTRSVGSGSVFGGWSEDSCSGATCTVVLTSSMTVTATFATLTCTPTLTIDGPAVGTDGITRIFRKDSVDFIANLQLSASICGSWTTAWTYQLGDDSAVPVPTSWIHADTLRIPRWTLEKYTSTGERYTFTLTATPPVGSTLSPLTASRLVQVVGTKPQAGFSPFGFNQQISPGIYSYNAFGGLPATVDYDNPPGNPLLLRYTWYAEVLGGDEVPPMGGQGTPTVFYNWTPAQTFVIRLTVCPADEPDPASPAAQTWPYGFTGCTTTPDFFITTGAGVF